ncbi:MAG TPA: permease prefix domain 2-containing transporter [Candidatus Sulfotelmatobacter sp.]|nr:permease prefix domain 2-containing transporter [Candidatus Sulfotelmatobacter sp.]
MTSQPHSVEPPAFSVWLIRFFALADKAESILGDLLEEFSLLASKSGVSTARNWYWRQTIKTVPRLAGFAFRTAPWMIVTAVVGALALRFLVGRLAGYVTFPVIHRYGVFFEDHHFAVYLLFNAEHLIRFMLIGLIVALIAREREMVTTATVALIFAASAVVGSTYGAIRYGIDPVFWRLTCYLVDLFVIVVAGAIVRTRRLAPKSSPSAA